MLYSIDNVVVFGKVCALPTSGDHTFKDILGRELTLADAIALTEPLANRDRSVVATASQVQRNMELGAVIIALWREYVVGVGLGGQSLSQLQAMSGVVVALLSGCLLEAATLIKALPEDAVVTVAIKERFAAACLSADHIVYA